MVGTGGEIENGAVIGQGQCRDTRGQLGQAGPGQIGQGTGTGAPGNDIKSAALGGAADGRTDRVFERGLAAENIDDIRAWLQTELNVDIGHAEIAIHQQDALIHQGQGAGHADGERRLADAALAGSDGEDTPGGAMMGSRGKFHDQSDSS